MGVSLHPLLMIKRNEESDEKSGRGNIRTERNRLHNCGSKIRSNNRPRRILMKIRRRRVLEGSRTRRPANAIQRKVRTLKKLIPHSESTGLDGLFRETTDYILSLQMRVKVMQIMVKELTGSDD